MTPMECSDPQPSVAPKQLPARAQLVQLLGAPQGRSRHLLSAAAEPDLNSKGLESHMTCHVTKDLDI